MRGRLGRFDREARGDSFLHRLNPVTKLFAAVGVVVYAASLGSLGEAAPLQKFGLLALLLGVGFALAGVGPRRFLERLLVVVPFGAPIVLLQPFLVPGEAVDVFFLEVSREGLVAAEVLGSRLLVAASAVILLSMVAPLEEVASGLRRLRVPGEFVLLLDLFVRQLFVLLGVAGRTVRSARSRGFGAGGTGYRWRLRSVASVMATVVARSMDRGQDTYLAMASRGYGRGSGPVSRGGTRWWLSRLSGRGRRQSCSCRGSA